LREDVGIEDKSVHVYGLLHVITTEHSWPYLIPIELEIRLVSVVD
jgi:hypothetical protein